MLVELILILILLGHIGQGWKDGLIHTTGRVVGAVIGFIIARSWSISISFIFAILLPSGWARFVAFIVIFVVVNRLIGWAFKLADGVFKILSILPFVKSINGLLGAILGFLEGIIILGGIIWIVRNFDLIASLKAMLDSSVVAGAISRAFDLILGAVL
ncbi:CvpA family protein [Patescibacteria group bacterium]|nr:CvpA family protein [Patescibacteria group bacterium]MBU1448507.1 CvpA family protein [Patescibacteria group bacterium]MBU2613053.1 CvpA family protein [Patescibacteria group bacterium]